MLRLTPLIDIFPREVLTMNEILFVVESAPEGGYVAKALGESIFTEADTLEELHTNVRDAVLCHFDAGAVPKMILFHQPQTASIV